MRKSLFIILMVCLALVGLVSCKNEIEPAQEELIYVSFENRSSRALVATLENFDVDDFYWSYEAKKNDGSGLKSGETATWNETGAGSVIVQTGKGLDDSNDDPVKVPGFSKGYWNFRLFAYTDAERTKLAYWGEADSVLIDNNHHMASVTVSPVSGADGYLRIGTITFVPASGISVPTDLVIYTDQLFELEGTQWVLVNVQPVDGVYTLPAKQYKFTRTYSFDGIPVANGSVIVTIYSNLTTTVSGSLSELTTYAEFEGKQNPDIVRETWGSDIVTESTAPTATVDFAKNLDPSATSKVKEASMPAAAAVAKLEELKKVVGADDNTSSTLKLNLSVDTTDVRQQSVTYDIGMEAVLTYTKNQTQSVAKSDVKNVTKYVLIDINLTSDISDVTVTHSGEAMIRTDDMSRAGEQGETDPKYVDVNKGTTDDPLWVGFYQLKTTSTGKVLHLKTKSFSPFEVTYAMTDYVAVVGATKYTSITTAIANAPDGSTVVLLKDTSGSFNLNDGRTITLDLGGHALNGGPSMWITGNSTLKIEGTTSGSSVTGRFCIGKSGNDNGNIEINGGSYYRNGGTCLHINGECHNSNVTIRNATLISDGDNGIQLNGKGKFLIENTTITGATAIYIKAGTLTIDGGTFTGNMSPANYLYNGNGANATGDAIVVDACEYPGGDPTVIIKDGTFTGTKEAIGYYQYDANNDGIKGQATIRVEGGRYNTNPTPYVPTEGYLIAYDAQANRWTVAKEGGYDVQILSGTETIAYMTLGQFRDDVNAGTSYAGKTVKLSDDVDLKNNEWTPIGTADHPFNGVFDGQNHTIKNLKVTKTGMFSGLFGVVCGSNPNAQFDEIGDVFNLNTNTLDADLNTKIAAGNYSAVIENLTIDGFTVDCWIAGENNEENARYSGALVGSAQYAYIGNCDVTNGTVTGCKAFGGVIGRIDGSAVVDCNTKSKVTVIAKANLVGQEAGGFNFGGIIGATSYKFDSNYGRNIVKDCTNLATLRKTDGEAKGSIAGIIGFGQNGGYQTPSIVVNCVHNGKIECSTGVGDVAGIAGGCVNVLYFVGCSNTDNFSSVTGTVAQNAGIATAPSSNNHNWRAIDCSTCELTAPTHTDKWNQILNCVNDIKTIVNCTYGTTSGINYPEVAQGD